MFFLLPPTWERFLKEELREAIEKIICHFLRKLDHCDAFLRNYFCQPQTMRQNNELLTECQAYAERCWSVSGNHKIVVATYWATAWPEPRLTAMGVCGSDRMRPVAMRYQWVL